MVSCAALRGQVKVVEIAHGLSNLAVGTLVFFLLAVALDHWVFRGGLGYFGRFVLFAALVIGAAYYFALNSSAGARSKS